MKLNPETNRWEYDEPTQATLYISDLHADRLALDDSIKKAKELGWNPAEDKLVTFGDYIDRGQQNFPLLDGILSLREQVKSMVELCGNHEQILLEALVTEDPSAIRNWVKNGGSSVLMEIAQESRLLLNGSGGKYNFPVELPSKMNFFERLSILLDWRNILEENWLERYDMRAAFIEAQQRFLHGKYAAVFDRLQLADLSPQGVLAIHAGVDDTTANIIAKKGVAGANDEFKKLIGKRDFKKLTEKYEGPLWMRAKQKKGKLLTRSVSRTLKGEGARMLIHAHDIRKDGLQTWKDYHGLWTIGADTGMSRAYDFSPSNASFVLVDRDGSVKAWSDAKDETIRDFGRLLPKNRVRPLPPSQASA